MSAANIKRVAAVALSDIDRVLSSWLPGGKIESGNYVVCNPTRDDKKPSFKIRLSDGFAKDFGNGDTCSDLVWLIAYIDGVKPGEAAKRLAEFLGITQKKLNPPKRSTSLQTKSADASASPQPIKPVWQAILPVPDSAPKPPQSHYKHSRPSMRWEYRAADGSMACLVYRFEAKEPGDRKQFFPLTYCANESGKREWRWQGLLDPRPMYHLDKIAAAPTAPILVTEGEKACDAAALLFPEAVCTTMLNGAQSPQKTDWSPLAGRTVWLWPDNDEAGQECMAKVAALAKAAGATTIKLINLSAFCCFPGTGTDDAPAVSGHRPLPEKWDAADAVDDGWSQGHIELMMQRPEFLQEVSVQTPAQVAKADAGTETIVDDDNQLSRFHLNDRSVMYFDSNDSKWWWVCSKLEITAFTRDAKNESWGRLLEFDDLDGTHHAWAMPMEMLKGDGAEYRGALLSMGLQIAGTNKARNLLTQYIQTAQVEQRARCVERTGWHGNVFVMPERTIGEDEERILYQSATASHGTFKQKGKLADWQTKVAALCVGNSRLVFAVSSAFAAPLLNITGMESGGVHLRGESSSGKTTALRAAASVWGGMDYLQRWRATDNGLEALAAQHSDCLLVLDELSQVDPKAAGEVAYMLANGSGKARANRTGGLRDPASWRILFLSSGEAGLAEHMAEAKKKPKAGQEIRLLDIPADAGAGLGMFENLNCYASGSVFSKALTENACKHYGTASIPYLTKLVEHNAKLADWIKNTQREFTRAHVDSEAGGQVHRAALRFALIGAAGELATKWEITGWQPGEAMKAAVSCYKAWLAQRGGAGNLEELNMLAQVRRFFESHGESRFTDWDRPVSNTDSHPPRTLLRAGYRKHNDAYDDDNKAIYLPDGGGRATHTEYYVFSETFKQEVCGGFDYRVVCKLLVKRGCLKTEGRGFTRKERLPGGEGHAHCFRITHKLFEDADDAISNEVAE